MGDATSSLSRRSRLLLDDPHAWGGRRPAPGTPGRPVAPFARPGARRQPPPSAPSAPRTSGPTGRSAGGSRRRPAGERAGSAVATTRHAAVVSRAMRNLPFLRFAALVVVLAAFAVTLSGGGTGGLPPIVFVARQPVGDEQVPGLGPDGRFASAGGKLMIRERNGAVRELLPAGRFFDVADPAVSYDAKTLAFAAVEHAGEPWRLWLADADGSHVRALTRSDRPDAEIAAYYGPVSARRFKRYDDVDPCWIPDGRVAFASTRYPLVSQNSGVLATNLFTIRTDGSELLRITTERNGAEEISMDPTRGRLVFARWWLSRFFASDLDTLHVTTDRARALPADTVDLWHAISCERDGEFLRLQGGDARVRSGQMAHQPVVRGDTTLIGVRPENSSMVPNGGRLGLQAFPHGFAAARPLAGWGSDLGWSACSPAVMPDGRLVFSMDETGKGEWGLWVMDARSVTQGDKRKARLLVDLPGTLELDAVALAPRPLPPPPMFPVYYADTNGVVPRPSVDAIWADERRVRFDCANVFANGPVDTPFPDAIPIQKGLKIRFFSVLPRPEADGADTLVWVGEAPVSPQGGVFVERTPGDQPMFEQIVDSKGRVVRAAAGPAHVPGFNHARPAGGTKCVGCHVGHSALFVPESRGEGEYTNVSPSATVTASGSAPGTLGPRAAVDRRTLGDPAQVAWIADSSAGQWLKLEWQTPIDARGAVVYSLSSLSGEKTRIRVRKAELVLSLEGRVVRTVPIDREWDPRGTFVKFPVTRMDALTLRPLEVDGSFHRRPATAVAELETIARIAWE